MTSFEGPCPSQPRTPGLEPRVYRAPAGARELLADPPLERWGDLAEAAARAGAAGRLEFAGIPGRELRERVRRAAVRLAGEHARRLEGVLPPVQGPWLVTGHQPLLYHPGVWVKVFAAERAARAAGGVALNLVVDSDRDHALDVVLPTRTAAGLTRAREVLAGPLGTVPFEAHPPPSPAQLEEFLQRVGERLAPLGLSALLERAETFAGAARAALAPARSLADWATLARRLYESRGGAGAYLEVSISSLAGEPEFLAFFLEWAARARELGACYNQALAAYRRLRRLRSPAQPFPDLREEAGATEVPFWVLTPAGRSHAFVAPGAGGSLRLLGLRGGERWGEAELPPSPGEAAAALARAGVSLRPKAVALTAFTRLLAADLFVHGVGGARYDAVTDYVLQAGFGVEPPPYAVASASLHLPLAVEGPGAGSRYWRRRRRELRFNPQRFVSDAGAPPEAARLAARKRELIRAIEAPGADRRALTREIEQVNEALCRLLAPVAAELAEQGERAVAAEARRRVAIARDYPFFLYDPGEVAGLLGDEAGNGSEPESTLCRCGGGAHEPG